ncbi:alanyl-tRNA editing protein [Candidatus Woesearchaeota archaeon]|nr:MAG: alanyl-tRNA editing protein [Candidatus Woesearchaeota archaeon]
MQHLHDSQTLEFTTTVTGVTDGRFVELAETYFYPVGGGQPHDEGVIRRGNDEFHVTFVKKVAGTVSHEVDRAGLAVGDTVHCSIQAARRRKLMRSHTAAHIVSALMIKKTGAKITGNQLSTEKVRIDYNTEHYDVDLLRSLIEEANTVIARKLPVTTRIVPRAEAERMPGVAQLAKGLPPGVEDIRLVVIEGFDTQACGGTHVANTGEIGTLSFLKAENKGKMNRRVYFTVND